RRQFFRRRPISLPHARREWLLSFRFTRPCKSTWQKSKHEFDFVLRFEFTITTAVLVVGLVPNVPRENALIASERTDNSFYIRFEMRIGRRVLQCRAIWTLYPARVMYARFRRALFTKFRIRIPHGIKKHEHWFDLVFRSDS